MFKYRKGYIYREHTFVERKEAVNNAKDEDFVNGTALIQLKYGKNISNNDPVDEFICSECGLTMRDWIGYKYDDDECENCYAFEFSYCPRCGVEIEEE